MDKVLGVIKRFFWWLW